jgi:hypothetical protein
MEEPAAFNFRAKLQTWIEWIPPKRLTLTYQTTRRHNPHNRSHFISFVSVPCSLLYATRHTPHTVPGGINHHGYHIHVSCYSTRTGETLLSGMAGGRDITLTIRFHLVLLPSSISTTARCRLWPVEKYPAIFSYLSPALSISSLLAHEDTFLPLLSHPFLGLPLRLVPSSS